MDLPFIAESQDGSAETTWMGATIATRSLIFADQNLAPDIHALKQLQQILVSHSHATMRTGFAHRFGIRRTVDVDIAPHAVDVSKPITARLATRQPQDTGQDPVPIRIAFGKLPGIDLSSRTTAHQNRIDRQSLTDLCPHDVGTPRRAFTSGAFAGTVRRRRHTPLAFQPVGFEQSQGLPGDRNFDTPLLSGVETEQGERGPNS